MQNMQATEDSDEHSDAEWAFNEDSDEEWVRIMIDPVFLPLSFYFLDCHHVLEI